MQSEHTGARRRRTDDDRDVNVEHGQSRADVWRRLTIFPVSNRRTAGLIFAIGKSPEAILGDKTAARARRLIQSRPRYIARCACANSRATDCRSSPRMIFVIALAASSPERKA